MMRNLVIVLILCLQLVASDKISDKDKITKLIAFKKDFVANIVALQRAETELYEQRVPAVQKVSGGNWICLPPYLPMGSDEKGVLICKGGAISPAEHIGLSLLINRLMVTETTLQSLINANSAKAAVTQIDVSDAAMQQLLDKIKLVKNSTSRAQLQSLALPAKSTLVNAKAILQ
jgi:hypothetical protein